MTKLVIGLGNPFRRDDAAGLAVASRLNLVDAVQCQSGSYELMDLWEGALEVVVVDATVSGEPPGTVQRFRPLDEPLPSRTFASTHAIGLAETVEMARQLNRLPGRMLVYGIEAASVATGVGMSPAVDRAATEVATEIDHA